MEEDCEQSGFSIFIITGANSYPRVDQMVVCDGDAVQAAAQRGVESAHLLLSGDYQNPFGNALAPAHARPGATRSILKPFAALFRAVPRI